MGKKPIVSVTYENESDFSKKLLTLHKMCVTSLLCGPWADLNGRTFPRVAGDGWRVTGSGWRVAGGG